MVTYDRYVSFVKYMTYGHKWPYTRLEKTQFEFLFIICANTSKILNFQSSLQFLFMPALVKKSLLV